jgi:hypothetical protein
LVHDLFSDLPSPANASSQTMDRAKGFAQVGSRHPPRIECGASFSGSCSSAQAAYDARAAATRKLFGEFARME